MYLRVYECIALLAKHYKVEEYFYFLLHCPVILCSFKPFFKQFVTIYFVYQNKILIYTLSLLIKMFVLKQTNRCGGNK